jgi:hypothetical protein
LGNNENVDLLADSYSNLSRWKNFFFHIFNAHVVNDIRQTEVRTAKPLVPEHSSFEVETANGKLKRWAYYSPDTDQIPAELVQSGGNILRFEIHKLF